MASKPKSPSVHTTPNPNGSGWGNSVGGVRRGNFPTQGAAAEAGRDIARRTGAEHAIHRPNGQIRDSNSYGNDPHPPRG